MNRCCVVPFLTNTLKRFALSNTKKDIYCAVYGNSITYVSAKFGLEGGLNRLEQQRQKWGLDAMVMKTDVSACQSIDISRRVNVVIKTRTRILSYIANLCFILKMSILIPISIFQTLICGSSKWVSYSCRSRESYFITVLNPKFFRRTENDV
jgi:hypothetical protein